MAGLHGQRTLTKRSTCLFLTPKTSGKASACPRFGVFASEGTQVARDTRITLTKGAVDGEIRVTAPILALPPPEPPPTPGAWQERGTGWKSNFLSVMSVLRKYTTISAIMLCLYALFGFLILPFLVRHFGEKALQKHLSAESTIAKVRMNPFLFSLQVEGLSTADAAGTWTAQWDLLVVDVSAKTLIRWYPVLDRITLQGSAFSFDRELKDEADVEVSEPSKGWREVMAGVGDAEFPKLHIDLLEVSEGQITFVDHTNAEEYRQVIEPINFSFSNLTTVSEDATQVQLSAETPRGALIEWAGTVETHPLRSEGTFSLEALSLENFSPYYQQFILFDLKQAVFGLSFEYRFDVSDLDDLFVVEQARVVLTELLCESNDTNGRLLSIDEIVVEGGIFKFPQMELGIERIGVSNGEMLVRRNLDGAINLQQLVAVPRVSDVVGVQAAADAAEGSGFTYHVDLIEIINYQLSWEEDLPNGMASLAVTVPTLRVEHVSSDLEAPITFFGDYRIGESGQVVVEGSAVIATMVVDASILVKDLSLDVGATYAMEFGALSVESGWINFEGNVRNDSTGGYRVTGSGALTSFVAERGPNVAIQLQALSLEGMTVTTSPFAFQLDRLVIDQPAITLRNPAAASMEAVIEPIDPVVAVVIEEGSASSLLALSIGEIAIQQGELTLIDESLAPSATTTVSKLAVSVNDLNLASSSPLTLELSALINQSPFHLTGKFQLNDLKAATALQFQLSGLSLPLLSPYSGRSVGRRISEGSLSLDSDWTVKEGRLQASNKILVNQLKFGDKVESEDALNLPLNSAVMLLAGPSGQMDLSLPLSGDLSSPKTSLGPIIRAAVMGLVTNVVSAPFKMLSSLVGSDEDLSVVEFAAGDSELSHEMLDRLNQMADALKQRPELKLEIVPMISPEDRGALSQLLLRTQILGDPKLEDDKKFRKGVTKLYRKKMKEAGTPDSEVDADTDEGLESMLAVILPDIELPESETVRLASERSAAVSEHFIVSHGIKPARLNVTDAEPSEGGVGLRFDLQ